MNAGLIAPVVHPMRGVHRASWLIAALLLLGAWSPHYPRRTTLDEIHYAHLVDEIRTEAFDDERVEVLRRTAGVSWMSCAQVVGLLPLFAWRESRLRALEVTVQAIVDPENAVLIIEAYPSVDRGRARALLGL
jgi:hypothetical protein